MPRRSRRESSDAGRRMHGWFSEAASRCRGRRSDRESARALAVRRRSPPASAPAAMPSARRRPLSWRIRVADRRLDTPPAADRGHRLAGVPFLDPVFGLPSLKADALRQVPTLHALCRREQVTVSTVGRGHGWSDTVRTVPARPLAARPRAAGPANQLLTRTPERTAPGHTPALTPSPRACRAGDLNLPADEGGCRRTGGVPDASVYHEIEGPPPPLTLINGDGDP